MLSQSWLQSDAARAKKAAIFDDLLSDAPAAASSSKPTDKTKQPSANDTKADKSKSASSRDKGASKKKKKEERA